MTKNYYNFIRGKLLFTLFGMCMLFCVQTGWSQITLGASPYTQNFNGIGSGLPAGWTVRTGATASALGTSVALVTGTTSWATTTGQFNNAASANSPSASGDVAGTQATRTDRALAVRQSGGFGDPGAAFVLQINNTSGLVNFNLAFKLMELDPGAAARTTTWNVDYGFGATPASFTNSTTVPATLTTTLGTWGTTNVTINFGSALDNNAGPVWIRIVTKAASAGSGSRGVAAIDDYSLSYSPAVVAPTIAAPTSASVTTTTADLGGNVTSNGGGTISARGIIWSSINTNPTLVGANTTTVIEGNTTTGVFTTPVTGLPSSTLIYFVAYCTNEAGTSYTSPVSQFTTLTPVTPTLTVGATTPSFGNICLNVQSGESSFTVSGINLTTGPVQVGPLANYKFSLIPGGPYNNTENIPYTAPNLPSTTIYVVFTPTAVQSYNGSVPVAGGGDSKTSVVTGSGVNSTPTVGTFTSSSITNHSATSNGVISNIGCSALTSYGIEYSTLIGFANGTGTPVGSTNLAGISFSSALTGLQSNTIYYYHAYATNSGGTNYGTQQSFTTSLMPPIVAIAATNETTTSFNANWNAVTGATGYFLDVSAQSDFLDPTPINLVEFSFPSNPDNANADGGTGANSSAAINAVGPTGATVYVPVSGSNTSAASATNWATGNGTYGWVTEINTLTYHNIVLSSKQRSSGTGPRDFKLQYKIGVGGTYTDVTGGTVVVANDWISGVLSNISLPSACDNQPSVFIRWLMNSAVSVNNAAVGTGGTSAIDEVFIDGHVGDFVFGFENHTVGNVLIYPVTGLSPLTTYYYRLRAADAGSVSVNSNTIDVTTLDPCASLAVSPTNNGPVCDGSTLNLFANPSGGTLPYSQFQWSGPGGFTAGTQDVSFLNGINGLYTVTVTDNIGCTVTANTSFVINPLPAINCGGPLGVTVDEGQCTATVSNAQLLNQVSGVVGTVTFSPAAGNFAVGTTLVTATSTNSCGTTSCSFNINVTDNQNPVITCPATANIGTDAGLCTSSASIGTATATDNCSVASVVASPAGPYAVGTHTITWTATDVNGNTATCTQTVNVTDAENPVITCPATANIGTDAGLCTSSASIGTATATDNCSVASVVASPAGPYAVGTHTITWTATDVNGNTATCTQTVNVTDTENPVITCPANIAVCDPGSPVVNFNVTATDNCSVASIVSTPASGSNFAPGVTTVNSVATDANGNTSTCSFTVTVSTPSTAPTAATTDAPFNNICLGNSLNLTANGGSLGTGASYKWYSGSCGGTLVGTGATINLSPAATTTYYVRAEGACNTTTCASVTVTVNTAPVTSLAIMPFTGMPGNVCSGTVATISIAPVANATFYVWDAPSGSYFNNNPLNVSPYTTATPSVTVTFGSPSGSLYNVGIQAGNACGSSIRQSQKVRGLTSVPTSISGALTACASSTGSYSTPAVAGATSYLWTITGNATVSGTGTTATVTFNAGWTGGTLCVAAQTTCYTSPTKCISISNTAAALGAISGTFTACPNSVITYSVPASAGAASYTWTLPPGATGSSTTNSINVSFGPGYNAVGSICVSVTSVCGVTSAVKCKTVAPGLPSQPNSITGPSNGLCGQSVVYTCPSQGAGVTYTWTVPSGATIVSGQGTTSINVQFGTFTTGSVCVTANNTCGSSISRCIAVKGAPATPGAITAIPGSWCTNTSGVEFDVNVANITGSYTLSWTYPVLPVATYVLGGGNSTSLLMDWGTGSGNINVTASNACGSGTKTSTWSSTCRQGEVGTVSTLMVSPNPTTGMVNISYTAVKGNTVINVSDLSGRVVMTQTASSVDGVNNMQLDMGKLAKGAYMLSVQSTQGNKQVKVVVE